MMTSNLEKFRQEVQRLCRDGLLLQCGLRNEMGTPYSKKELEGVSEEMVTKIQQATFKDRYQKWYNASLAVIKQLLPDRVTDFISAYHQDVKKEKNLTNYGIEDYILGMTLTSYSKESNNGFIRSKFELQYQIVSSLPDRLILLYLRLNSWWNRICSIPKSMLRQC